jgi:RNA polymerase sigma factor (sigma-70 family)
MTPSFEEALDALFRTQVPRLFRYLDRLSGDPELARDLVQDTFVRLFRRGRLPDQPEGWLITVATNLWRNARSTGARRVKLLGVAQEAGILTTTVELPDRRVEAAEERTRVRIAIERLTERDRQLLLLMAEGYSYREIAAALDLRESSVGTLLARAKQAFRDSYGGGPADAL